MHLRIGPKIKYDRTEFLKSSSFSRIIYPLDYSAASFSHLGSKKIWPMILSHNQFSQSLSRETIPKQVNARLGFLIAPHENWGWDDPSLPQQLCSGNPPCKIIQRFNAALIGTRHFLILIQSLLGRPPVDVCIILRTELTEKAPLSMFLQTAVSLCRSPRYNCVSSRFRRRDEGRSELRRSHLHVFRSVQ